MHWEYLAQQVELRAETSQGHHHPANTLLLLEARKSHSDSKIMAYLQERGAVLCTTLPVRFLQTTETSEGRDVLALGLKPAA